MEKLNKVKEEYNDILSNLTHFALIKTPDSGYYQIFDIRNQSTIYIEYKHDIVVKLMIEGGVKIVNDIKEVENPDFIRYMVKWDDEKKDWVKFKESSSNRTKE